MARGLWVSGGIAAVAATFVVANRMKRPGVPSDPTSFQLIGEGQMHSVFRYIGADPKWRGKVLRLRMRDAENLRHETSMTNQVMPKLFGIAFVPMQEVVYPNAAFVEELQRQTKRGVDGNIAIKSENVVDAPVSGTCVSFEIKPKCGLVEREHFPSRYQMLQHVKLKNGDISRISEYNPVDLFSGNTKRVERALKALVNDPQNNFLAFVDGKRATADEAFKLIPRETLCEEIISCEVFRSIVSAQCWAAGKSAAIAYDLLEASQIKLSGCPEAILAAVVRRPGDERMMRRNEQDGDKLLEQHKRHLHKSGSSARELDHHTAQYLQRFLLGRTAMDCSVILTFLKDELGMDTDVLVRSRFVKRGDYWVRISVVDTELKPVARLPLYAKQMEQYVAAYLKSGGK